MEIGRVIGKVWATKKNENLNGQRFLIVSIMISKEKEREGFYVVADNVGAGVGDMVLISRGGSARHAVGAPNAPIDAAIVGIIDSIEVDDA